MEGVSAGTALEHELTSVPQNRLVARKIDLNILPPLCWVYFLQILDKSCVGYAANFGLQTETVSNPIPGLAPACREGSL